MTRKIRIYLLKHPSIFGGHLGANKTEARILERLFWSFLRRDVRKYIQECKSCQLNKNGQRPLKAPLQPILPSKPKQLYTFDITGPLPITLLRNRYILVVCDHFSKWVKFYAMKDVSASTVAKFLVGRLLFDIRDTRTSLVRSRKNRSDQAVLRQKCLCSQFQNW